MDTEPIPVMTKDSMQNALEEAKRYEAEARKKDRRLLTISIATGLIVAGVAFLFGQIHINFMPFDANKFNQTMVDQSIIQKGAVPADVCLLADGRPLLLQSAALLANGFAGSTLTYVSLKGELITLVFSDYGSSGPVKQYHWSGYPCPASKGSQQ